MSAIVCPAALLVALAAGMYHSSDFTQQTPGRFVAPETGGIYVEEEPEHFATGRYWVPSRRDPVDPRRLHPVIGDYGRKWIPGQESEAYRFMEPGIPATHNQLGLLTGHSNSRQLVPGGRPPRWARESFVSYPSMPFGLPEAWSSSAFAKTNMWMILIIILAVLMAMVIGTAGRSSAPMVVMVPMVAPPPSGGSRTEAKAE